MSSTGMQTIEEERDAADEPVAQAVLSVGTQRRLLRAVEHYKAACLARSEAPDKEESWLVLLAALGAESHAHRN